jgi:hypothetical protein
VIRIEVVPGLLELLERLLHLGLLELGPELELELELVRILLRRRA